MQKPPNIQKYHQKRIEPKVQVEISSQQNYIEIQVVASKRQTTFSIARPFEKPAETLRKAEKS